MEPDESQKPTLCEICDKTFASPSHLAVHERIHTNERPFSCETCGKTFTQKSALVRHVRIHTNEKPFECSKCDRRFNDNGNHKKHERTCNGTKSKSKAQKGITNTKKGTIKSKQGAALAQQKPGKKEKKKLKKIKRLKRVPLTEGNDCPEIIDRLPGSALVTQALDTVPQVENQENNPSTQDLSLPPVSDSQKPPEETCSKADSLSQPQDSVTKGNNSIDTEDECALENSFSPPEKKSKMANPENICMKCGESYPSKEAKRLHDCDSIMATMADDGHVRGTPGRNTTLNPQEQSDAPPDKDSDPPDEIASNPKVVDQSSEESDSKGDTSMEDEETMGSPGSSPSSAEKTSLLTGVFDELTSNLSETPGVEAEDVEKLKVKQVFQCSTCKKRFNKRSALKRHVKTHSEDKPFSCSKCDYGCNDLSNLKKHEKTHKNKRPFKCRTCGKKFSLSHHLHVHERIHRNERSYKCEDCGKAFTQLGALNRHKFIHTGDKPFACEVCDYRSNDKGNLRKHERTHSSNATTTTHSKPTTSPNNPAKIQKLDPEEAELEKLDRSGPEVKTEREPRLHRKSSFKALTLMQKYSAEEKLFENLSDEIVSENGEDGSKGIEYGPATYTVPKKKAKRCGECEGCRTPNCQVCSHCLDMPKYGGPGTKRQVCRERKCLRVYYNVFERDTKGVVDNKSSETPEDSADKKESVGEETNGSGDNIDGSTLRTDKALENNEDEPVPSQEDESVSDSKTDVEKEVAVSLAIKTEDEGDEATSQQTPQSTPQSKRPQRKSSTSKGSFSQNLVQRKKTKRCGDCEGCRAPNCQLCSHCLDMPKYGGPGTKRQVCRERKCFQPITQPLKLKLTPTKNVEKDVPLQAIKTEPMDEDYKIPQVKIEEEEIQQTPPRAHRKTSLEAVNFIRKYTSSDDDSDSESDSEDESESDSESDSSSSDNDQTVPVGLKIKTEEEEEEVVETPQRKHSTSKARESNNLSFESKNTSAHHYRIGDLVWAKLKGFPSWPGKIVKKPEHVKISKSTLPASKASDEAIHCVHFFGSYDYGFVTAADIKLYGENRATKGRVRGKPAVFANAVKEIEEALAAESNLPAVSKEDPRPYFVMENPNVPAISHVLPTVAVHGIRRVSTELRKSSEGFYEPNFCNTCGKTFYGAMSLKIHQRIHSEYIPMMHMAELAFPKVPTGKNAVKNKWRPTFKRH